MEKKIRLHELDWLRIIAILILLYFHTGMLFVGCDWHIKDLTNGRSLLLEHIMAWLHHWRMPLLLFISGAGTYFALAFRSGSQFAGERFKKLLVPLLFGMFVIVPPQIYFERIDQFASYWEFYPTVFELIPYPAGGSFSWHHLWFIAYLLLYSLIGLPLFLYLRSEKSRKLRDRLASILSRKGALALFFIPSILVNMAFRPFLPHDTHALVDDWAAFSHYFVFFLAGYLVCSERRIWESIGQYRRLYLTLALISLTPFYYTYHFSVESMTILGVDIAEGFSHLGIAWFWILATIGMGQRYLANGNRYLRLANEGIYPFYVLHQTAIVVIGYYLVQLPLGMWTKFFLVSSLSGIASAALYLLLIRPFGVTRFLFGLKKRRSTASTMQPVATIATARILGENQGG